MFKASDGAPGMRQNPRPGSRRRYLLVDDMAEKHAKPLADPEILSMEAVAYPLSNLFSADTATLERSRGLDEGEPFCFRMRRTRFLRACGSKPVFPSGLLDPR